jgi:hypothetical protein
MSKRGWRDEVAPVLQKRKEDAGMQDRTDVLVMFDFLDADEGRPPGSIQG